MRGRTSKRAGRILVAEDDPEIRELIGRALVLAGHQVDLCEEGATALAKARQGGYALVILDYRMPRRLGTTVLKALRQDDPSTPVILMSAHLPDDVRAGCRPFAPVQFLAKPFSIGVLRDAVARSLRPRSGRRGPSTPSCAAPGHS
ncbi:MAG TPA: response regulator [Planctomycetota bacterium]|nr:response regulator [Planctomycetota bacterium]